MGYQLFNVNDPDLFDSVSCRVETENFDKITTEESTHDSLEILRYLVTYADVHVKRFSIFHPTPRDVPNRNTNPKIYVTTLSIGPGIIRMEIYIPKTLPHIAVYVKVKYGCENTLPS
jgi:hypothetical protein